jgi:hypothetical protein
MKIEQHHIDAFDKAETLILERDFKGYLQLKELLPDTALAARSRFRILFTNYYGMNTAGLSDAFKDRFFQILFSGLRMTDCRPDFASILNELSLIPGRRGHCAMPFSFVSKLVAIHMEDSPIYDKHVSGFFGVGPPAASVPKSNRINWYVDFLGQVKASYLDWALDQRIAAILKAFRARDSRLLSTHDNRLLDFLVWKVGNKKLL